MSNIEYFDLPRVSFRSCFRAHPSTKRLRVNHNWSQSVLYIPFGLNMKVHERQKIKPVTDVGIAREIQEECCCPLFKFKLCYDLINFKSQNKFKITTKRPIHPISEIYILKSDFRQILQPSISINAH